MTAAQKKALKILDCISLTLADYSYADLFSTLIKHVPIVPFQYEKTNQIGDYFEDDPERNKSVIYRARENEDNDLWDSYHKCPYFFLSEISIVPPTAYDKIKFGRCNKANEPRFYAATKYNVACIEALTSGFPREGRQIRDSGGSTRATTGEWLIKDSLNLVYINHSKEMLEMVGHVNPDFYSIYSKRIEDENRHYIHKLEKDGKTCDDIEYHLALKDFFTREINKIEINTDHDYYLSNFYCDIIFNHSTTKNGELIDGIVYPSVAYSMQNKNIALHPRALNKICAKRAFNTWMVYFPHDSNMQFIPDNGGWAGKIENGEIFYPLYQKVKVKKYACPQTK